MTDTHPSPPTRLYVDIEATLAATAQGREFLLEHARRSRQAETRALLDAIARLEAHLGVGQTFGDAKRLRSDLDDMSDVIARTRTDLAGMAPGGDSPGASTMASGSLDWIVSATEKATSHILDATEKVQEVAWTMRESGSNPVFCDRLDRHVTDIYAACASQDVTAQRVGRVVSAFAVLEKRIATIGRTCGSDSPTADFDPPLDEPRTVLSNNDIDVVPVAPGRSLAPPAEPASSPGSREAAVAELRRIGELGTRDKLRLFT